MLQFFYTEKVYLSIQCNSINREVAGDTTFCVAIQITPHPSTLPPQKIKGDQGARLRRLCPPSAVCFPGEAPAQLAAHGAGPSQMGTEASPQEQTRQARPQDRSPEQAAESLAWPQPQLRVWPPCQRVLPMQRGWESKAYPQTSLKS